MNSNNRTALAVAATAAMAVIALWAVLRFDTMRRRIDADGDDAASTGRQLDRWNDEGGSIPVEAAGGAGENGREHA